MNDSVRWLFDRWRLTLIGCPLIGLAAYFGTGRGSYTAIALVLSAAGLALRDTWVQRERDRLVERD